MVTPSTGQDVVGDSDWDLFEVVQAAPDGGIKDQFCVDQTNLVEPSESKEETGQYILFTFIWIRLNQSQLTLQLT